MRRISKNVLNVLETWEGQNIVSVKMTKMTDFHKESRVKSEEKGKDNDNFQDLCKTHQDSVTRNTCGGLGKKKVCEIYYLWVTVITPDIHQI